MTEPNMPARPVPDMVYPNGQVQYGFNGLTIREEFARTAMLGLLTSQTFSSLTNLGETSVRMADALIEALNKPKS